MRGNWGTTGPLVHVLNQQQQQQHTIVKEQRQPLHSPTTTPAWGIADRSVKEEPMEDKNNDSGVSPDHYTSSTANSSFSPSSATSQDSTTMQCSTYDYTPQGMFKNCAALPEQAMDVVSSTAKSPPEDAKFEQDILQCPVCEFTTVSRLKFSEHLSVHCTKKGEAPEFVNNVLDQLIGSGSQQIDARSSPTQGERSEQESEETEEPGLRVPRMNSQGKVKTFRCKQCSFVAITKLEFWDHSRSHIKAEKLLTCPKCPFVTEYKHHLEYHLRNHFGSKPFKCELCTYSCVNKSMLNSHLKSHSNIYQYRCANCSYATKYCHSLKLHLRKYSHQPAMVLNTDGSPNPLPIIDVYGTRRGPKQKPIKQKQLKQEIGQNGAMATNTNLQLAVPSPISPIRDGLPHNPMNGIHGMNGMHGMHGMNGMNGIDGMNGMHPMVGLNGVVPNQPMMPFPYNHLFSRFPLGQFPGSVDCTAVKHLEQVRSTALVDYAKSIGDERMMEELPQNLVVKCFDGNRTPNGFSNELESNEASKANEMLYSPSLPTDEQDLETKAIPLDLSKPGTIDHAQNKPAAATNSLRATGTSRRKGKAVKLDRRVVEEDTDEEQQQRPPLETQTTQEQPEDKLEPSSSSGPSCTVPNSNDPSANDPSSSDPSFSGLSSSGPSSSVPSSSGATDNDDHDDRDDDCPNEFNCRFCEIGFGNVVMYTVHMGYHGYSDPYTCNMCGFKCTEKVSFFLHIARSKHA